MSDLAKRLAGYRERLAGSMGDVVNPPPVMTLAFVDELTEELAKHQNSSFHPDWSLLEAGRESLKEHQQMIRELQADLATANELLDHYRNLPPTDNWPGDEDLV